MQDELERSIADLGQAESMDALEATRVAFLGRKGQLTLALRGLSSLEADRRKLEGARLNRLRAVFEDALAKRRQELLAQELEKRLISDGTDISLPVRVPELGTLHPLTRTLDEAIAILGEMGFSIAEGPDIEDDFHNFTALNFPPGHPARLMQDTFFLKTSDRAAVPPLLRTHTSPVQVRTMMGQKPPIRIVAPGRTYRRDYDQTHTPMFSQIEGLVIEEGIHMGHLKGCLQDFVRAFFEIDDLALRFRPSFFPFTEPSAEVDIACERSDGELRLGGPDWLEILGCGMVHPNVLAACGLDPECHQGFAFGMGIERIAGLKYGMPDLRSYFMADLPWLRHYGFSPLEWPSLLYGLSPDVATGQKSRS